MRLAAMVIAAAITASATTIAKPQPPALGQQAPDFTLIDQNGKRVRLSAAHGEKAVVVFYRGYW